MDSYSSVDSFKAPRQLGKLARYAEVGVVFFGLLVDSLLLTCVVPFLSNLLQTQYDASSLEITLIFSSKSIIQLIFNPIASIVIRRVGPTSAMLFGAIVLASSSIVFAFAHSYGLLLISRAIQGLGSSSIFCGGLSHLAQVFTTDEDRGNYMGKAMSGIGLGVLLGPVIGGTMYSLGGQKLVFFVVAAFSVVEIIFLVYMLLWHRKTGFTNNNNGPVDAVKFSVILKTCTDPYIVIVCSALMLGNMSIGMIESLLPLWIQDRFDLSTLDMSVVFLPSTIAYFLCVPLWGYVGTRVGRHILISIGICMMAIVCSLLTLPNRLYLQLFVIFGIGGSMSFIDASVGPVLADIVDARHPNQGYSFVFALADMAFCLGYIIGPNLAGVITETIGFVWATRVFGVILVCFAPIPVLVLMRYMKSRTAPTSGSESKPLLSMADEK